MDPGKNVAQQLQASVDRLRVDIERVEIWAAAVIGFAQPIPELDEGSKKFVLPPKVS